MIANVSPAASCCEHTLNTLRYGDRVKELKKEVGTQNPAGERTYVGEIAAKCQANLSQPVDTSTERTKQYEYSKNRSQTYFTVDFQTADAKDSVRPEQLRKPIVWTAVNV